MTKIDLKRELKELYTAKAGVPRLMKVPVLSCLMIDGQGGPENPNFHDAMSALYSVAFTIKFLLKMSKPAQDFAVMPLEGLWWTSGDEPFSQDGDRSNWRWTLLIAVPPFVTSTILKQAVKVLTAKGKATPVTNRVRLGKLKEGSAVQTMHIGPYDTVASEVNSLVQTATCNGCAVSGKWHEIYLSDPRRTAPEKLKTIVRFPVQKIRKSAF